MTDQEFRAALAKDAGLPARSFYAGNMTEAQLLAEVARRCEKRGIRWVHIDTPHHNKRRQNMIGFPDLFLCGPGGAAFWELKSRTGVMAISQKTWRDSLRAAGQRWDLWRPQDLESGRVDQELNRLAGL